MDGDVADNPAATETPVPVAPPPGDYHLHLSQRAEAFVRTRGGMVHEDALVGHVFGTAGSASLWRPLLKQVLATSDGLQLRSDGYWSLPETEALGETGLLVEFVALDVETTGLRPLHQRVIEIAAIRYRDGREVERIESLCNPDKRIPAYIVGLTGIGNEMVTEAPRFAELADEIVRFIGPGLIVGHNVGFDLSFVNAELKRLGRPALINERLDTLPLASKLVPGLRRPSLDKVAAALGLADQARSRHRAAADAALTAEAALRLAGLAAARGVADQDALRAFAAPVRRPRDGVGRGRATLDRGLLADIPKAPGVYLMRDAFGHVVYIGKAKCLRDRVSSYFSQPMGYTRKMDGLLESLTKIDVEVVGSELEALLLESNLIKRYQPRYNTALRSYEHYPFIRVNIGNAWPRITLAKTRKDDGARYFGPFRNKAGARKTVDLLGRVLPLRTCSRSFKDARSYGSPCIELDLGRCLGPCVGRADRDEYAQLVRDVVRFLDGHDDVIYDRLWRGLEDAAERLDFEKAGRLRKDLRDVQGVVAAQRRLREAAETQHLVLVLPSADPEAREVLLVASGRLWAQVRAFRRRGAADVAARLEGSWARLLDRGVSPVDCDSVDDANILNRWLYRHAGHPALLPILPPPAQPDWAAIAERVFALDDAQLAFATRDLDAEDEPDVDLVTVTDRVLTVDGVGDGAEVRFG